MPCGRTFVLPIEKVWTTKSQPLDWSVTPPYHEHGSSIEHATTFSINMAKKCKNAKILLRGVFEAIYLNGRKQGGKIPNNLSKLPPFRREFLKYRGRHILKTPWLVSESTERWFLLGSCVATLAWSQPQQNHVPKEQRHWTKECLTGRGAAKSIGHRILTLVPNLRNIRD